MKAIRLWNLHAFSLLNIDPVNHRRSACSSKGSLGVEAPSSVRTRCSAESPEMELLKMLDVFSLFQKEALKQ